MRATLTNNGWNTTEWGLSFLRVSSFPLDPSCTFETEEEFQNYLEGNDIDKPYLGQIIALKTDKYHVHVVQEYADGVWIARPLNEDELESLQDQITKLREQLEQSIKELEEKLKGDDLTKDYDTLAKIQDIIIRQKVIQDQFQQNFQKELDATQAGIGLSQDGSFSPDQETVYLKNATSVMNALKTLDALVGQAINNCSVSSQTGNDIILKEDGIYHNIDTEYANGVLTVKVNGSIKQQHILGLSSVVETGGYDPDNEVLYLVFKLQSGDKQRVDIPAGALIDEWTVDNSHPSKVVELTKERVISGPDKLSADVRLSTNKQNILEKDGNTLLVRGTADNITYSGDVTVKDKIDQLETKSAGIGDLNQKLEEEVNRAKLAEQELQQKDTQLSEKIDETKETLTSNIAEVDAKVNEALESIRSFLQDTDSANSTINKWKEVEQFLRGITDQETLTGLLQQITTSTEKELQELRHQIDMEVLRATSKEELLDHRIDDIKEGLDEVKRKLEDDVDISKQLENYYTKPEIDEMLKPSFRVEQETLIVTKQNSGYRVDNEVLIIN